MPLGSEAISTIQALLSFCDGGSALFGSRGLCHSHPVREVRRSTAKLSAQRRKRGAFFQREMLVRSTKPMLNASSGPIVMGGGNTAERRHPSEMPRATVRTIEWTRGERARTERSTCRCSFLDGFLTCSMRAEKSARTLSVKVFKILGCKVTKRKVSSRFGDDVGFGIL